MTKLLYVIISGQEAEEKFDIALISAIRMVENKRVEKMKILFFGRSELLVARATGDRAEKIRKLIQLGVIDSACTMVAKNFNIEEELKVRGVPLEGYGTRLATLLDEGYVPLSF
jgi:hypothetical protein